MDQTDRNGTIRQVMIKGEVFNLIEDYDEMRPFFMSITSAYDHWMFISSNGGLTAGRKNAEFALFPYYTDDKITESANVTGSKSIFRLLVDGENIIWEPFTKSSKDNFLISRNLYKNPIGNKILFEEKNHDLQLTFQYSWTSSDQFGFIRNSKLINLSHKQHSIEVIDGIQNILPASVGSELQKSYSNLIDAYKRSELDENSGLGIFALSAIIVDRAEPSEALKANIAWSTGMDSPRHLLSSLQLSDFRNNKTIYPEFDVRAEKGAYFLANTIHMDARESQEWFIITDVNLNHSAVVERINEITNQSDILDKIRADIDRGNQELLRLVASSDGLQKTSDELRDNRHFANVTFNIMRGGIVDNNYLIQKEDFIKYIQFANNRLSEANFENLNSLPEIFTLENLKSHIDQFNDYSLKRLSVEYLPLKFSRRHGDPSRPWNIFSINLRDQDSGHKVLDYQGNWRDIFQNWEALSLSFPSFLEGMIFKFLNATTFDGYNPYRVTKGGFDWETIEEDDPWSYIGYWGDHQIIYLLKLLEWIEKHQPDRLNELFHKELFVYAAVPYKIKSYEDILRNPKDTVEFDRKWDLSIREKREQMGSDGAILSIGNDTLYHVNFLEKILATILAKVSNYIPDAGIWMNTQRPEWNDANNALVGNGVSMVTLYYLRRFLSFFENLLSSTEASIVDISSELYTHFTEISFALQEHAPSGGSTLGSTERRSVVDKLQESAQKYREHIYQNGFSGQKTQLDVNQIQTFFKKCKYHLDSTIKTNRRKDGLFHAYNIVDFANNEIAISRLDEMLEGQVAVLSSGFLDSTSAVELLDVLRNSSLYREDQNSYILYPNKSLPGFLQKNNIPKDLFERSELLKLLEKDNNTQIVERDILGHYHFNARFRNKFELQSSLDDLPQKYRELLEAEETLVHSIYEEVFNHKKFTGRSGTFYGYEGLGSIYWHMVSKLALATMECCLQSHKQDKSSEITERLIQHYYDICDGIGVHKSPQVYGAFTTDPYSHTPAGKGAQQPGMTGQVKEDILCRFGELGVAVQNGQLSFLPHLLKRNEFLTKEEQFDYITVNGQFDTVLLSHGTLAFTYCQVPIIYELDSEERLELYYSNGSIEKKNTLSLSETESMHVFNRTDAISMIKVYFNE